MVTKTTVIKAKPKAGPKSKSAPDKAAPKIAKERHPDAKLAHHKKWRAASAKIITKQHYTVDEATKLLKSTSTTKFVSAAELHVHVNHEGRGALQLPHQIGKKTRVAVANEDTLAEIAAGKINFDVLIAEPAQMAGLAKFARTLGPKGLMPNPKSGTVTTEIEKVKKELASGKQEYRTDAGKNIHLVVGKADSEPNQLAENIETALRTLQPLSIKSAALTTTMGPSIKLHLPEVN